MPAFRVAFAAAALAALAAAQQEVSFPTQDGGVVFGDLYGSGDRGVVLVHGGRFNKESWEKQAIALRDAGFEILAINLRGVGQSRGPGQRDSYTAPLHLDVLAAVRYLRTMGAASVSLVGGSMGGDAAAQAVVAAQPGEIKRLVILAAAPENPEMLNVPKLFIVARDDASGAGPRLPGIRAQFAKAPEPKELIVVDGSAHAQFLFETNQGERVMREIVRFLTAP